MFNYLFIIKENQKYYCKYLNTKIYLIKYFCKITLFEFKQKNIKLNNIFYFKLYFYK